MPELKPRPWVVHVTPYDHGTTAGSVVIVMATSAEQARRAAVGAGYEVRQVVDPTPPGGGR